LGVYVDSSGAPVVVMPSERMTALAASDVAPAGVSVRVQTTDFTAAQMKSIHDDLIALSTKVTASYGFYFDIRTAKEVIQTKGPSSEFASIAARYPGHVEIQAKAGGGLSYATFDRNHDTSAFFGGGYISGASPWGGTSVCTTGFEAHNGSHYYLNTAGHCFSQGASISSGYPKYLGYVSSRQWPTWDIEWIYGASYSPQIYNGKAGDVGSHINVYGRKYAWVGQTGYCATGQASGRVCDWNVTSTSATFVNLDHGVNVTDNLYAYSGTKEIPGNSGGPVYYPYNGGALIAGTIVGFYDIGFGNTNYSTKAAESLAHWNLEVVCVGTCVIQP
jgi:hypothetical protein